MNFQFVSEYLAHCAKEIKFVFKLEAKETPNEQTNVTMRLDLSSREHISIGHEFVWTHATDTLMVLIFRVHKTNSKRIIKKHNSRTHSQMKMIMNRAHMNREIWKKKN